MLQQENQSRDQAARKSVQRSDSKKINLKIQQQESQSRDLGASTSVQTMEILQPENKYRDLKAKSQCRDMAAKTQCRDLAAKKSV